MRARAIGAVLLCVLAGCLAGCQDLPEIEAETCGNHVTEPANGEDCDGFPADGCRPPGSVGECRFDCSPAEDGTPGSCPTGHGCGLDWICRVASGRFEAPAGTTPDTSLGVELTDLDGDGRDDLVNLGNGELRIDFHGPDGLAEATRYVPGIASRPAIAQLTDRASPGDLAVTSSGEREVLRVYRGQTDRTLLPTAYSPVEVPAGEVRFVPMDAMPAEKSFVFASEELMILYGDALMNLTGQSQILYRVAGQAWEIAGEPRAAQLDEAADTSPCSELVLAFSGQDRIHVYETCRKTVGPGEWGWNSKDESPIEQPHTVELPGGVGVGPRGVQLADLNLDSHLDLFIDADDGQTYMAFGVGDGTFHSDPTSLPAVTDGDGQVNPSGLPVTDVLAVGDVNFDGKLDYVTGSTLAVSAPAGETGTCLLQGGLPEYYCIAHPSDRIFSAAWIGDINANGLPDVVGISGARGVDVYNNAGGYSFNRFTVPTEGLARLLAVGDYDGDLIPDVAIAEAPATAPAGAAPSGDVLSVLFGRPWGVPETPVSVGRLGQLETLVTGQLTPIDSMTDLVALSAGDPDTVAIFVGSSDRQLQSPFSFQDEDGQQLNAKQVMAGQFDDDQQHADLAVYTEPGYSVDVPPPSGGERAEANLLWLLPSTGEARLDLQNVMESEPLNLGLYPPTSLGAVIDLDADGIDELVFLGQSFADATRGQIAVFRAGRDSEGRRRWQLAQEEGGLDESYFGYYAGTIGVAGKGGAPEGGPGDEPSGELPPLLLSGAVAVRDVDGDQLADLVALGAAVAPDYSVTPRLVVFPNRGSGQLAIAERVVVDNELGAQVTAFTLLNADADPAPEILLATDLGAFVGEIDLAQSRVVGATALAAPSYYTSATSGDVNGDGVDDVALGSYFEGNLVLLGAPVTE
jgi:hypothetical protein